MSHPNSPERRFQQLIDAAIPLINSGKYKEAVAEVFSWGNGSDKGWTDAMDQFYRSPSTERAKALVKQMKELLRATLEGFLPLLVPSSAFLNYVELAKAVELMQMLGSSELITTWGQDVRNMLIQSQQQAENNRQVHLFGDVLARLDALLSTAEPTE